MNAFNDEWQKEKDRQTRITQLEDGLVHTQSCRLEVVKREGALALARTFGNRLDARVSERIIEGLILRPEVLCTIGGGVNELPTDAKGWDALAVVLASEEPLAKLSIDASDAVLKEELRQNALAGLRPEQRLSMARAGTLDQHIEDTVLESIEARSGV